MADPLGAYYQRTGRNAAFMPQRTSLLEPTRDQLFQRRAAAQLKEEKGRAATDWLRQLTGPMAQMEQPPWQTKLMDRLGIQPQQQSDLRNVGLYSGATDVYDLGEKTVRSFGDNPPDLAGYLGTAALAIGAMSPVGRLGKADKIAKKASEPLGKAALEKRGFALRFENMSEVPEIRKMPLDEALTEVGSQPHLIPAGKQSPGKFVGGPRDIKSWQALTKMRDKLDANIDAGVEGGDWYRRYRDDVSLVTGGDANQAKVMADTQAQFSAGVDPGSELGFALKETSGILAGMPTKAARPAQHQAMLNAAALNDTSVLQLGPKTREYAKNILPFQSRLLATGVNDFRWANEMGFREPDGSPFRGTLTESQHTFVDYETALAVKRANARKLGGRSDWTGQEIQAAGWVAQKADALFETSKKRYVENAITQMTAEGRNDFSAKAIETTARKLAFGDANRTIGDHFQKHTLYATHETIPGTSLTDTGHLSGMGNATQAQRDVIGIDPRGSFATAPRGRDAPYAGFTYEGPSGPTGFAMRVQPTIPMQGVYENTRGKLELNPGEVARPLVGLQTSGALPKSIAPADRKIVEAVEALRGGLSGQDISAAHIVTDSGRISDRNAVRVSLLSELTPQEAVDFRNVAQKYGYDDVADTGDGATLTNFAGPKHAPTAKELPSLMSELKAIRPDVGGGQRSSVDSVAVFLDEAWAKGEGSGAVTKIVTDAINATPEIKSAMNRNPYLGDIALNYIERDKDLAKIFGPGRKDLERFRRVVASGPGWVDKLMKDMSKGVLPATGFILLGISAAQQGEERQPPSGS
jgi:hypothetical protein